MREYAQDQRKDPDVRFIPQSRGFGSLCRSPPKTRVPGLHNCHTSLGVWTARVHLLSTAAGGFRQQFSIMGSTFRTRRPFKVFWSIIIPYWDYIRIWYTAPILGFIWSLRHFSRTSLEPHACAGEIRSKTLLFEVPSFWYCRGLKNNTMLPYSYTAVESQTSNVPPNDIGSYFGPYIICGRCGEHSFPGPGLNPFCFFVGT